MYWMLLPMDPDQKLHLETRRWPQTGGWSDAFHGFWDTVRHLLGAKRR